MNKKNIMSFAKKLTAGVLAVGMVVAGIVVTPKQADAAVAEDVVVYEELDIATYWNNGKKAPVKEGYVFGGWFTEITADTPTLTFTDFNIKNDTYTSIRGAYNGGASLVGTEVSGYITLNEDLTSASAEAMLVLGGTADLASSGWDGVQIKFKPDGKTVEINQGSVTENNPYPYKFSVDNNRGLTTFAGNRFKMTVSFEPANLDGGAEANDIVVKLYINDYLWVANNVAEPETYGADGSYYVLNAKAENMLGYLTVQQIGGEGMCSDIALESYAGYEVLTSSDGTTTKNCVPLTAAQIDENEDGVVDDGITAVAKFVPAQVLSVKAQNGVEEGGTPITSAECISESNPMWVRVMTSLDSTNYDKIGFDIYLANKKQPLNSEGGTLLETSKVYSRLYVEGELTSANTIFGGVSNYVCAWKLEEIDTSSNAEKIIYVRPYWKTMDGTKVLGLAKYVHIEDEYKGYISVPINLLSTQDIAAGTVNMSYDYTGLELISEDQNKYFEEGRILPEMKCNPDTTNKIVRMVGNGVTAGEYNSGETIYANIRFKKPEANAKLNFDMTLGEFCNWEENTVENEKVKVWDIAYEVTTQETTN